MEILLNQMQLIHAALHQLVAVQSASLNSHQLYVYVYNTILVSNTAVLCPFQSLLRLLQCSVFVQLPS